MSHYTEREKVLLEALRKLLAFDRAKGLTCRYEEVFAAELVLIKHAPVAEFDWDKPFCFEGAALAKEDRT